MLSEALGGKKIGRGVETARGSPLPKQEGLDRQYLPASSSDPSSIYHAELSWHLWANTR